MILPYDIKPLEGEQPFHQSLCMEYLQLGIHRSIDMLHKAMKERGDLMGAPQLYEFANLFEWRSRAEFYDAKHYESRELTIAKNRETQVMKWQPMGIEEVEGRLARIARFEMPTKVEREEIVLDGGKREYKETFLIDFEAVLRDHPYMIQGEQSTKFGKTISLHNAVDALKVIYQRHLEEAKYLRDSKKGDPNVGDMIPIKADRTTLMYELIQKFGEDTAVQVFDAISPVLSLEN